MIRSRSVAGLIAGALLAAVAVEMVLATGTASAAPSNNQVIRLHRGGPDASVWFTTDQSAETLFDVTASAPDADWSVRGDESAVVSVSVDGAYETDIVIPAGATDRTAFRARQAGRRSAPTGAALRGRPVRARRAQRRLVRPELHDVRARR